MVRLFALLLGFSIAEVLAGFARTLRLKLGLTPVAAEATRVGWLVPLLGLLVVMDQMSFWLAFYVVQDWVPFDFLAMLCVLFLVGGFYVVSTLVFPAHPEKWPEFDAYYLRVKSAVVGGLVAVNLVLIGFATYVTAKAGVDALSPTGNAGTVGSVASLAFLVALAWLLVTKRPRTNLVLLIVANAALIAEALSLSR